MRKLFSLLTVPVLAASTLFSAYQPAFSQQSAPLQLKAHIQDFGDIDCNAGEWCGTTGSSKRLEGFALQIPSSSPKELGVTYKAHIQNLGNTPIFRDGQFVGTRNQSLRLEGFSIQLTGRQANKFKVLYQCHIQNQGDSRVMSNGQFCGTKGQGLRLEAMKVWLVRR